MSRMKNDLFKGIILLIVGILLIAIKFIIKMDSYFLIYLGLFLIVVSLFVIYEEMSKQKKSKKNYDIPKNEKTEIPEEKKSDTSNIKTINYDSVDGEKSLTFYVYENNGGILKLDKEDYCFLDVFSASFHLESLKPAILTAEYAVGEYDAYMNRNHLCITGREGRGGNFYIDINDIAKVIVNTIIGCDNNETPDSDEYENPECFNLIIHTKQGSVFDKLEYDLSFAKNVESAIEYMLKINNTITIDYVYNVFMTDPKYHSIKYNFGDNLKVTSYVVAYDSVETKLTDRISYEITINYKDITNTNFLEKGKDELIVIVEVSNDKYFFSFADSEESKIFYDELKKHCE